MSEEIETEEVSEPSEAEAKAREMGWAPQEEWRGDPEKWVDAETFLERGEQSNGILRERNDKLFSEIKELKAELRSSVKEFGEATRKAEERAYQKAMTELQQQQAQAVANGDVQSWQKLEQEKDGLQKEYQENQQQPQQQADPAFEAWKGENSWYESDVKMTAYAEQIAPVIARRHGMHQGAQPTRAFYDEIAAEVRKEFPDKFRNTNRDGPSAVNGASNQGGKPKKGKSYSDLPPEAKAACDKFVKQGLMKKEEYVKEFFGE